MATLTEFLTNIANAIRTKKGTTEIINAQNFASEIESIKGGSSGLKGYSTSVSSPITNGEFIGGLKEDGTWTTTFSTSDKYISIITSCDGARTVQEIVNAESETLHTTTAYYDINYVNPTADDWYIIYSLSGGGSGA